MGKSLLAEPITVFASVPIFFRSDLYSLNEAFLGKLANALIDFFGAVIWAQ